MTAAVPTEFDAGTLRHALLNGPLNRGLHHLGERWTVAILLGAFMGVNRYEAWLALLGIPRATLANRLRLLCELDVLVRRTDQEGYRLTAAGLALYDAVLMVWLWEKRFGGRDLPLPSTLVHRRCGQAFTPELICQSCHSSVHLARLQLDILQAPVPHWPADTTAGSLRQRGARMGAAHHTERMGLGLRVDRWALLTVSAVMLGCHHFGRLQSVLGVGSSVLSGRLTALVDAGLLHAQTDVDDARKRRYALTPASHALLGYIVCFDRWAATHLPNCPGTIAPRHIDCGALFVPTTVCSHCRGALLPREVQFVMEPEEMSLSA